MSVDAHRSLVASVTALSVMACGGESFRTGNAGERPAPDAASPRDSWTSTGGAASVQEAGTDAIVGAADSHQEATRETGTDAAGADATADGRDEPPLPIALIIEVARDSDDGTWIDGSDERLHYSAEYPMIEVGTDAEMARAGLRFELPIPPGSVIERATLHLTHFASAVTANETIQVRVFDSLDMPPFNDAHVHPPSAHVPDGIGLSAVAFEVGSPGSPIETADLTVLLQPLIERSDWREGAAIGFFLAPLVMDGWVGFTDSAAGSAPPALQLVYTPPR